MDETDTTTPDEARRYVEGGEEHWSSERTALLLDWWADNAEGRCEETGDDGYGVIIQPKMARWIADRLRASQGGSPPDGTPHRTPDKGVPSAADPPERCICVDPSPDLPGDTGVVMECPVHGEVAPPVKGENVREAICGTCDGVIPMYSNPCEYCGGTNVWPGSSPPVEEGERGERIRTLAERAVVLWDGKDLTAALSDETRVEKFAETFNELVDLIRARFPLGDDAAPDARQGEGDEA